MDPLRNPALSGAKSRILSNQPTHSPPPSYHMVVNPNDPIPNLHNPYDPEEDSQDEEEEEELPQVTIVATTQIKGHGNIISVPPMDAVRIAGLLHTMIYGPPGQDTSNSNAAGAGVGMGMRGMRGNKFPRIRVEVNCGVVVAGDRNVVGPGLGDVARQMQMARNNQNGAVQTARSAAQAGQTVSVPVDASVAMGSQSASESGKSEASAGGAGSKRKAEGEGEGSPELKKRNS